MVCTLELEWFIYRRKMDHNRYEFFRLCQLAIRIDSIRDTILRLSGIE